MKTLDKKIRIVTAASLFDGHDAAINIMRRIMQANGAEVIHLGHNRSVHEVVEAAIEEDANAIAITSYQGGHSEYFKYMKDLLEQAGCGHIKIFGGGGGTILPDEIRELHAYGISRIYSPDDGRKMGLEGMIKDLLDQCATAAAQQAFEDAEQKWNGQLPLGEQTDIRRISRQITHAENGFDEAAEKALITTPVIGITGTGGAGKSSVTDELVRRMLLHNAKARVAVISVDPSKKKTGGALLGDRIRMNSVSGGRVYMRSLATREDNAAISGSVQQAVSICRQYGFDYIILETAGTGQSDTSILDLSDVTIYVMTPEYGAASQLEKINMIDYASIIVINKSDKPGADDAMHEVRRQYKRSRNAFTASDNSIPVVGTVASKFHDEGINKLFELLLQKLDKNTAEQINIPDARGKYASIIPPSRTRYLSNITEVIRSYNTQALEQARLASQCYQLHGSLMLAELKDNEALKQAFEGALQKLTAENQQLLEGWHKLQEQYSGASYTYTVRQNTVEQPLQFKTLSGLTLSRVYLPRFNDWGDVLLWQLQENVPGSFPFTSGVFPLKREGEDPTRMFAGEGCPERTNRRFHYVAAGQPAKRLSTAFDSVTLYGEDPGVRPDVYGKVGNSGVNVATVDDAKKLYSGFDLCSPQTSVSMTINGPAPILLAFFLNAAIDQQCEKWIAENGAEERVQNAFARKYAHTVQPHYYNPLSPERLPEGHTGLGLQLLGLSGCEVLPEEAYSQCKATALQQVRGTVQADILKEDQAQNTCIFNTAFALRLMGDVQQYFINQKVRNFYSVSISGYHIAEAGANPISQLAFTLSNGFTYVEYYLSRGMHIDDFAPNLSFFFSNGMDPEYSVIGRVARRIWAKAMKLRYGANERSQKLKYHIQTSGRSLHAQEIDFNDIRTTLQALYAIYDNCNSLHTNAYDEAITTPTEESVRRAMAIQLIINRELGLAKTENFVQGSFVIEELTNLVEEAVMAEFDRISDRGGVLGAMERMYQRNKIQEESLYYEHQKHTGELPLVGVNMFLSKQGSPTLVPQEVIRSSTDERDQQIENLHQFLKRNEARSETELNKLKEVARQDGNLFKQLMETVKYCSLGQITHALYEVGGQYRRNM